MEKGFMSEDKIAEVRKSIWDISGEEYHKKVLEYNEFRKDYLRGFENERLKTDTMYRLKTKFRRLFKRRWRYYMQLFL